ncbi:OmpH family outer membrane protein [Flavobacterium sp. HSC-61S13]|uniref:OmpH family outer membrane protein n=1 Tax=Flavobacterium sp. HSC-61S13 TaxID=2910963 RepID=UPI0020A05CB0|nr:OmpH family outer membrane protein [Flavobacterium sp. HSC-61S13]MCP1997529.1 Skp family chaperone for outer membrane proteins [Flavobacterium sp. HSC-61S13]
MKLLFASIATVLTSYGIYAQGASVRVAYIDMEYILKKTPEYIEANNQLEQKAAVWKKEADAKKAEIKKIKDNLNAERTLLTRELIEEREENVTLLENELLEFQQKKFGANGDLITQKIMLVKPIQDQVFTVIQEIADAKRFDYVLDKGTESTMLFATKRHDISEQVIQRLARAKKRQNLTSKEVAVLEDMDKAQDQADLRREKRDEQARRKQDFEESKKSSKTEDTPQPAQSLAKSKEEEQAENLALLKEQQKIDAAALKQKQLDLAEQRQQEIATRKAEMEAKQQAVAEQKALADEQRKRLQQERLKEIEDQKIKIAEENDKKQKALDDLKKQREQEALNKTGNKNKVDMGQLVEERKQQQEKIQQEINRKKEIALEERKAAIEASRKMQEEKRLRTQQQQEDAKKAREEMLKNSMK